MNSLFTQCQFVNIFIIPMWKCSIWTRRWRWRRAHPDSEVAKIEVATDVVVVDDVDNDVDDDGNKLFETKIELHLSFNGYIYKREVSKSHLAMAYWLKLAVKWRTCLQLTLEKVRCVACIAGRFWLYSRIRPTHKTAETSRIIYM